MNLTLKRCGFFFFYDIPLRDDPLQEQLLLYLFYSFIMAKLFKLKWYCNYCKRQCSDENGLRVHNASYSHQAAVEQYNRDPAGHTSSASNEFLSGFCAILQGFSTRNKLKRREISSGMSEDWVDSNLVYQEYIRDRHHVHLSGTRWKSVAGFVRFLGQKGLAQVKKVKNKTSEYADTEFIIPTSTVEEEEREGDDNSNNNISSSDDEEEESSVFEKDPTKRPKWFIKLIDKSPEAILAAKSKSLRERKKLEEELQQSRQLSAVDRQAAAQHQQQSKQTQTPIVIVKRKDQIQQQQHRSQSHNQPSTQAASIFTEDSSSSEDEPKTTVTVTTANVRKRNLVLEELAEEEAKIVKKPYYSLFTHQNQAQTQTKIEIPLEDCEDEIPWIRKGLIIRIGNANIGNGKYLNVLAVIDEVIEDFGAQVTVLKNGDELLLDQDDCLPVSKICDDEFDTQISKMDQKLLSTALKTDRCVILAPTGWKGKEGRITCTNAAKTKEEINTFEVEVVEAGSSHIHRKNFILKDGDFCIYWE